MYKNPSTYI